MAFLGQTFSVGQVLTAAQMNQVDENIDEVRRDHKGSTAPPELTAGVTWLDDSGTEWVLKQHDGVNFISKGSFHVDQTGTRSFIANALGELKNALINGNFDIWQRGTSFNLSGSTIVYTADRWKVFTGASGVVVVSRQSFTLGQTDIPGEPTFFFRFNQTTARTGTLTIVEQNIENVRTFAGKTTTFTFWAKVSSGTKSFTPRLIQRMGTGGTPSADVTVNGTSVTITASWQKFTSVLNVPSLSGKTLGTDGNHNLSIGLNEDSFSTFTLDLAQAQVEVGSIATDFERRPIGTELALAQRYYEKSYNLEQAPGTVTTVGNMRQKARGTEATAAVQLTWRFAIHKRTTPTVTVISPGSGSTGFIRNISTGTDLAAASSQDGESGAIIQNTASTTNGDLYSTHATADAEL